MIYDLLYNEGEGNGKIKPNENLSLLGVEELMITLIKGKARKSVYMEAMFKGTRNSLYVQYGDVYHIPPADHDCWRVEPDGSVDLETYLVNIFEAAIDDKSGYRNLFLYANLKPDEIGSLINAHHKVKGELHIIASVQDESIQENQLILEEIRF